jgi:hypothetical protein
MNVQTQQMTQKKTRLDAIISCLSRNGLGGIGKQNAFIAQWAGHATRIIVVGGENPTQSDEDSVSTGYDFLPSKDPNPSLIEALDYYVRKGSPDQTCLICDPAFFISDDNSQLYGYVKDAQMNRAWCGCISVPGAPLSTAPDAFVCSGYILQYLAKDIPDTLTFMTNAWAKWIHAWCQKRLPPNRYFNASGLNLIYAAQAPSASAEVILDNPAPVEAPKAIEVSPEATEPATEPVKAIETPVKRKRGRPVGWRKHPVTPAPVAA